MAFQAFEHDNEQFSGVRLAAESGGTGCGPSARVSIDVDNLHLAVYLGPRDAKRMAEWLKAWADRHGAS